MGGSESSETAATTIPPLPSSPSSSSSSSLPQQQQEEPPQEQQQMSLSEQTAKKSGFSPSAVNNLISQKEKEGGAGRYRVASADSERYFYESQPSNQAGGSATANFKSNLQLGAEGEKATAAAKIIQEEVANQGGKLMVIDNKMSKEEIRNIVTDSEGLNISAKKRDELSKQWRFMLASDPIQYGMDAGFLSGSVIAGLSLKWPINRQPIRLGFIWCAGFCVGMVTFPMAMIAWEEYNMTKVLRNENDMMKKQREEFYASSKKSSQTASAKF